MNDLSIANILATRSAILDRNAALRNAASTASASKAAVDGVTSPPNTFAATFQNAMRRVNTDLENEDIATEAYERGETTDIASVALMQARASVSFETVLQVRNKVLSAYKDIMSMPV